MAEASDSRKNSVAAGLATLILRGFLLWIVVPLATVAWLLVGFRLRRRGSTFGQYLGWIDVNLIAFLQRTILRPITRSPLSWVPVKQISEVSHRLRASDPL